MGMLQVFDLSNLEGGNAGKLNVILVSKNILRQKVEVWLIKTMGIKEGVKRGRARNYFPSEANLFRQILIGSSQRPTPYTLKEQGAMGEAASLLLGIKSL